MTRPNLLEVFRYKLNSWEDETEFFHPTFENKFEHTQDVIVRNYGNQYRIAINPKIVSAVNSIPINHGDSWFWDSIYSINENPPTQENPSGFYPAIISESMTLDIGWLIKDKIIQFGYKLKSNTNNDFVQFPSNISTIDHILGRMVQCCGIGPWDRFWFLGEDKQHAVSENEKARFSKLRDKVFGNHLYYIVESNSAKEPTDTQYSVLAWQEDKNTYAFRLDGNAASIYKSLLSIRKKPWFNGFKGVYDHTTMQPAEWNSSKVKSNKLTAQMLVCIHPELAAVRKELTHHNWLCETRSKHDNDSTTEPRESSAENSTCIENILDMLAEEILTLESLVDDDIVALWKHRLSGRWWPGCCEALNLKDPTSKNSVIDWLTSNSEATKAYKDFGNEQESKTRSSFESAVSLLASTPNSPLQGLSWLEALTLYNVRSFNGVHELTGFAQLNILIGKNNSGKSNIMAMLRRLSSVHRDAAPLLQVSTSSSQLKNTDAQGIRFQLSDIRHGHQHATVSYQAKYPTDLRWTFKISAVHSLLEKHGNIEVGVDGKKFLPGSLTSLPNTRRLFGFEIEKRKASILRIGCGVLYVPSLLTARGGVYSANGELAYTGDTLADDISVWDSRTVGGSKHSTARREEFESYCSLILGSKVRVWVKYGDSRLELQVQIDNEPIVPLSAMGDGVFQAMRIAGALVTLRRGILLLEEPDLGLHPSAHRGLVQALKRATEIQVFLTTHSNHILDTTTADTRIYKVSKQNTQSVVHHALPCDLRTVLDDLGVRPSSVLLANCTLWVEGKTEVITFRHWINLVYKSSFIQGAHYEFVPFQGEGIDTWAWSDDDANSDMPDPKSVFADAFVVHDLDGQSKVVETWTKGSGTKDKTKRFETLEKVLGDRFHPLEVLELENLHTPECIESFFKHEHQNSTDKKWVDSFKFSEPRATTLWESTPLGTLICWQSICVELEQRQSSNTSKLSDEELSKLTKMEDFEAFVSEVDPGIIKAVVGERGSKNGKGSRRGKLNAVANWIEDSTSVPVRGGTITKKSDLAKFATGFYTSQDMLSESAKALIEKLGAFIERHNTPSGQESVP